MADIHIVTSAFRRSVVRAHRSNTQVREWVRPEALQVGARMPGSHRFALTDEKHRASR